MNRKKRVYAKVIDICLLLFIFIILTKLSSGNSIFYYMFTYPFVILLILYIYFGVLGNYFQGSLGKKLVGLVVINKKNNFVPSMVQLFIREPSIQFVGITFMLSVFEIIIYNVFLRLDMISVAFDVSTFFATAILINCLVVFIILITCFFIRYDWWNKKYKVITKKVYDTSY